ncbi:MAG: XRE family transcriptional regulator [Candidatus Electryonea clarkiae]|nr:XRE family transcriptional regulator [Candidatus Electryonea clarkiae]MDP8285214.1 XRE family transcriptional regulator [Candidatus Electryonea clarkiae]
MKPHLERIKSINPERIQWCCDEQGITPLELAGIIKIAQSTFTGMMTGKVGITFKQLSKIANYFNRGVLFFLEQGPVNAAHVYTPQFRTIANQKSNLSAKVKSIIERVERQREAYLSLQEDLGGAKIFKLDPPELPRNNPKLAASIIREWLELKELNDFDSYRADVESKGILVFRSNGYKGAWQIPKDDPIIGFSLYHQICPVIVVKKQFALSRQTFTLMHELGHLLLHLSSRIDDEDDLYNVQEGHEQEANAFAGSLLVPDEFLSQIYDQDRPEDVAVYNSWLKDERKAWGVSSEVILRRLLDAGRLDQEDYKAYRRWRADQTQYAVNKGYRLHRYGEPRHLFGNTFVSTILDSLSANKISLNKASSYLDNLKIKDLHKLEGFYANL